MLRKTLMVVRHGQSRTQTGEEDTLDPDLSRLGAEQARSLRSLLADMRFDHIRVSPLLRARRTWELSGATAEDVAFDSRIVECTLTPGNTYDYSPILPYRTSAVAKADACDAWNEEPRQRVSSIVRDLKALPGTRILLFGHCGIFHVLRRFLLEGEDAGAELYSYDPAVILHNTAIGSFALDGTGARNELLSWNETPHLARLELAEYLTR